MNWGVFENNGSGFVLVHLNVNNDHENTFMKNLSIYDESY